MLWFSFIMILLRYVLLYLLRDVRSLIILFLFILVFILISILTMSLVKNRYFGHFLEILDFLF